MRDVDYNGLGDVVRDGAAQCGAKPAIIFQDGTTLTYAALDRRASQAANMLRRAGAVKGERIAILARNALSYAEIMFGAAKLGAILVPVNWRLAPPEIGYILRDAGAQILITDAALLQTLDNADLHGRTIIVLDGDKDDGYEAAMQAAGPTDPREDVSRTDTAMLVYTSGTTGNPKGAMLSHASFARHCGLDSPSIPQFLSVTPDDVGLLVLPLFHIGSIEPLLRMLFSRATAVLHREFDPARFLADMQQRRATTLFLVPTALQIVLRHPNAARADFSSVKRFFYGASPIPLGLLQEALARFDCEFVQAYGMTETCGTCVMLAPEDHADPQSPRLRAAGRPILGAALKIIAADGATLPPHSVGEIALRGSGLMSGYWNRPDATAATIGEDGWLRSGDAGYVDEDGYVYIHDRVKDMIVSGGENIYPAEVESALYAHPDVAEVAVVGVPDPRWGEAVKAVVVPTSPDHADGGEIIAWARTRIASYKVPKSIDFAAELPKNAAGKLLRRTIKAAYWAGQDRLVN